MCYPIILAACILLSSILPLIGGENANPISPYNQHLPDCTESVPRLKKTSNAKTIICPMIRDEEGFLSEWIAYYQMHGVDHFMIFDDNSTDNSLAELKPWIDRKMVTIVSNWTIDSLNMSYAFRKSSFKQSMTAKALLESFCKETAVKMGYDFYISLDVDEYLIPLQENITIVDSLLKWFNETQRSVYCISKNNFQSSPHLLEPVNLLTIEAYQSRMPITSKMSYYTTVAPKCAYQLTNRHFSVNTTQYIVECCHFHGCQGWDFKENTKFCTENHKVESAALSGKKKKWYDAFIINHYSRSLEKYCLKSKTWRTASGEVKAGQSSEDAAKSYDISKFLSRNIGWHLDNIALRYSCQLRETLREMTGENVYLRPGTQWYRNAEFGKEVTDPDKRGRYGRPNPPGFKFSHKNPYHYHGEKLKFDKQQKKNS
jgi:hypothetical protein